MSNDSDITTEKIRTIVADEVTRMSAIHATNADLSALRADVVSKVATAMSRANEARDTVLQIERNLGEMQKRAETDRLDAKRERDEMRQSMQYLIASTSNLEKLLDTKFEMQSENMVNQLQNQVSVLQDLKTSMVVLMDKSERNEDRIDGIDSDLHAKADSMRPGLFTMLRNKQQRDDEIYAYVLRKQRSEARRQKRLGMIKDLIATRLGASGLGVALGGTITFIIELIG